MRHALEWWRQTPAPSLAEQIVRLEALTPADQRDGLGARLAQTVIGGNSVKSRANVEALASMPADPRLTDFLIAALGAPVFDVSSGNPEAFARAVATLLVKQPDPRVATWKRGLSAFLAARAGKRAGQLSRDEIATLERIFSELTVRRAPAVPEDVERDVQAFARALEPFAKATTGTRGEQERLLADLIAHRDDARLQVYGDWLTEHGLPQGELIARMLAGETSGLGPLQQKARPACFSGAQLTWEKGLPVKALFANRDGVRAGSWGPELEWGTIRETDVVPIEGGHAEWLETLHVGTSFVKDLASRTQPLGVKTLGVLSLTSSSRPAWKKVTALRKVERLEVRRVDDASELAWFLATDTGKNVSHVAISSTDELAGLLRASATVFEAAPKLRSISLREGVVVSRLASGVRLELTLANAVEVQELVRAFSEVARPACASVLLIGPESLTAAPELRALGSACEVRTEASSLLSRVKVERAGELTKLVPEGQVVFDAAALESFLAREQPVRLELSHGVDFRETARLWELATARGVAELTLCRDGGDRHVEAGPSAYWYSSRFTLTLRPQELRCDAGRGGGALLEKALVGVPRFPLAVLRVAGGLATDEVKQLERALRTVAGEVQLGAVDPESQLSLKYVKSRKRLEIRSSFDAAPLAPGTLDAVLAKQPKVELVEVFQRTLELAPWLAWVAQKKLPLTFRIPNQMPDRPVRVWWDEGLRVFLSVRDELAGSLPKALLATPAKSVVELELSNWTQPSSAWLEAAKHVAKKVTVTRQR